MSAETGRTVREVGGSDTTAVVATLGRAFFSDPVFTWLLPDEKHRKHSIDGVFDSLARYAHLPNGGSDLLADETGVLGAALWDPPNRWQIPVSRQLRGIPGMIRWLRSRSLPALRLQLAMEAVHPKEPHWYLAILGTDPRVQSTGVGGALLRNRLDRCDAEGSPAYLESSNEANVPYYERFGFRVTGEIVVPRGGPTLWAMWRDPAA